MASDWMANLLLWNREDSMKEKSGFVLSNLQPNYYFYTWQSEEHAMLFDTCSSRCMTTWYNNIRERGEGSWGFWGGMEKQGPIKIRNCTCLGRSLPHCKLESHLFFCRGMPAILPSQALHETIYKLHCKRFPSERGWLCLRLPKLWFAQIMWQATNVFFAVGMIRHTGIRTRSDLDLNSPSLFHTTMDSLDCEQEKLIGLLFHSWIASRLPGKA